MNKKGFDPKYCYHSKAVLQATQDFSQSVRQLKDFRNAHLLKLSRE